MTLIILAGMVVVVTALVLVRRGPAGVRDGLSMSVGMLRQVALMLLLGMLLAGMTQVILPADLVGRWMGSESGIVGVLIGAAVGSLVPAGPFVVFPLLGSILATGAGAGAVAAFITAWSVTPISRTLVWELPFLGGAFTASRFIVMLPFPILAGLLTPPIFRLID